MVSANFTSSAILFFCNYYDNLHNELNISKGKPNSNETLFFANFSINY